MMRTRRFRRFPSSGRSRPRTQWFPIPYSLFVLAPGALALTYLDNLVPNAANVPFTVARIEFSAHTNYANASDSTVISAGILVMNNEEAGDFAILTAPPDPLAPNHSYLHWDTEVRSQAGTGGVNGPAILDTNDGFRWSVKQRRRLGESERLVAIFSADPANNNAIGVIQQGRLLLRFP